MRKIDTWHDRKERKKRNKSYQKADEVRKDSDDGEKSKTQNEDSNKKKKNWGTNCAGNCINMGAVAMKLGSQVPACLMAI